MKKLFTIIFAVLFIGSLFAVPAMACDGPDCGPGLAFGLMPDVGTFDIGGGIDGSFERSPNGFAGGLAGGGGIAGADADGFVVNGFISGETTSTAGGFASSDSYRLRKGDIFSSNAPDKFIGVGNRSDAYAITGASLKIKVDPNKCGFGEVGGYIGGIAGQGTVNVSGVGESPLSGWNTDGHTGGIAGQGSVGGFYGHAYAESGPDYTRYEEQWHYFNGHWHHRRVRHDVNSRARARVGAEIEMSGYSLSESYRYMNDDGPYHTEGMGTRVAAGTKVTSDGYADAQHQGFSDSGAYICGGFVAVGGAKASTVQTLPGAGMASANASGLYVGAGPLGTSFSGSVNGYTATSITTISGMNGAVSSSSAGMSVNTSTNSGGFID